MAFVIILVDISILAVGQTAFVNFLKYKMLKIRNGMSLVLTKIKKVQVGNDQEMAQSERNSHSLNRGVGKN